jgi:copper homeostasis protein
MEMLAELIQLAGNRIEIMPGSGVTEDNLVEIIQKTGARSIHSSAKIDVLPTQHPPFTGWEKTWVSSKEKVRTMADLLQNL